jgi:hypothetical protein
MHGLPHVGQGSPQIGPGWLDGSARLASTNRPSAARDTHDRVRVNAGPTARFCDTWVLRKWCGKPSGRPSAGFVGVSLESEGLRWLGLFL